LLQAGGCDRREPGLHALADVGLLALHFFLTSAVEVFLELLVSGSRLHDLFYFALGVFNDLVCSFLFSFEQLDAVVES